MKKYITFAKTSDKVLPYEEAHREIAYRAATEGIVLLENDGTLPIKPGKVALYGAGASHTIKGGSGSGEVNERHSVTVLEGLNKAGFEISTKKWLKDYVRAFEKVQHEMENEIRSKCKVLTIENYSALLLKSFVYPFGREITMQDIEDSQTDTCIYVVARQSGEGADRKLDNCDFQLSDVEKHNLRMCAEHYKKTIVVLNIGSSFDTTFIKKLSGINAVVYLSQPGSEGGNAFADLITGKVTPSGKLTDTWVKAYDDVPFGYNYSYLNGDIKNEDYLEDIFVGYRYYDTFGVEPAYPFGYGLSYTHFDIQYCKIQRNQQNIQIYVKVQNTGNLYSGKEVVQLYASCPQGKLAKEYQRLCAFAKTKTLAPGETQELLLEFPISYLTSYSEDTASYLLEQGSYLLRIGNSSKNTKLCAVVQVKEEIVYSKHRNICPPQKDLQVLTPEFKDNFVSEETSSIDLSALEHLQILPADVPATTYTYNELPVCSDPKLLRKLKTLSVKERVELIVGVGFWDMISNFSYVRVPGAVGDTTSKFVKRGIPNIALADGPAGLRLLRRSAVTKFGISKMIDMQFHAMNYFPETLKRIICGNPKKDQMYYQYTTAFPIACAIAQTWNTALSQEIGDAIGEEMQEYGVTFWLAPGINIHRNPLCGRNFEYYSEDPLLSGKLAAAVTKGVQKHRGCFVTLKHFCCNNHEENREYVSCNLTERALREIYLRAFEIGVREGNAHGIMTSYNKVNEVYTSNSKDLLTHVVRHEWNFKGAVMTDWNSTSKGRSDSAKCLTAGNDLLMPGSGYDKEVILDALKTGRISRRDLNRCAANVLRVILAGRKDGK